MCGRVCFLNILILFLALLGTLSVTQTTSQALAPTVCVYVYVCVGLCLCLRGPPSPALLGVRGGTKRLGTSSFCQFLMRKGLALSPLLSTNKEFCWQFLKSKFSGGRRHKPYWGAGSWSSFALEVGVQQNPWDIGYLFSPPPHPPSLPGPPAPVSSAPSVFTWGRGRRPGESCWSNSLCRDSRVGRVRMTSLGAGDRVKAKH